KKNAKIPKDKTPSALTLEDCQALLAAAPERRPRGGRGAKKKTNAAEPAQAAKEAKAPKKAPAKKKAKKAGGKKAKTKRSPAGAKAAAKAGPKTGAAPTGGDDA